MIDVTAGRGAGGCWWVQWDHREYDPRVLHFRAGEGVKIYRMHSITGLEWVHACAAPPNENMTAAEIAEWLGAQFEEYAADALASITYAQRRHAKAATLRAFASCLADAGSTG